MSVYLLTFFAILAGLVITLVVRRTGNAPEDSPWSGPPVEDPANLRGDEREAASANGGAASSVLDAVQYDWLLHLKAACDAGYYKTEADTDSQIGLARQDKTCQDCFFWAADFCRFSSLPRRSSADTCLYFHMSNSPGHTSVVDVGKANHRISGPSREQSPRSGPAILPTRS
jgi:hypothetical protein